MLGGEKDAEIAEVLEPPEGAKQSAESAVELLSAGKGQVEGLGPNDFSRRLAANLSEHRGLITVEERFNMLQRSQRPEDPFALGFHKLLQGSSSIVLGTLNKEDLETLEENKSK